jgi:hypothetical protein
LSQTFLEYRFYKKEGLQKWFIAPHVGFGMFTLQKPNYLILYDYYNETAGVTRVVDCQMVMRTSLEE